MSHVTCCLVVPPSPEGKQNSEEDLSLSSSPTLVSKQGQGLCVHIWMGGWHHHPAEQCCLARHPPFSLSSNELFGMWCLISSGVGAPPSFPSLSDPPRRRWAAVWLLLLKTPSEMDQQALQPSRWVSSVWRGRSFWPWRIKLWRCMRRGWRFVFWSRAQLMYPSVLCNCCKVSFSDLQGLLQRSVKHLQIKAQFSVL